MSTTGKIIETGRRSVAARSWGGGNEEGLLMRFLLGEENVLELDSGDGCTSQ